MRRILFAAFLTLAAIAPATLQAQPARPKITGISHLAVYTSNPAATERYYTFIIGAVKMPDPENPQGVKYAFSATQYVEVLPLPADAGVNRLDHTAYNTESADGMRKYLATKGWKVPASVSKGSDGSRWFAVLDPEGNKVEFVQPNLKAKVDAPNAIGHHIIHIGMMVHDRAKEDTFYRDILGFRPYWFGGMNPEKIDWVSQQLPDAHDWLEYMLSAGPGTGIPATMTQRALGVLDHLSIGQDSVDTGYAKLKDTGRLVDVRSDAHTQIGKDGKGQFNLYDPDGIRLELMNWSATQKPCCSPFTAPDPTPSE
jgi:catechol 2,3-dioxygenase-like lactoylglutathione lyase family enzyme